jgi:flagellar L-ring protein FlgH
MAPAWLSADGRVKIKGWMGVLAMGTVLWGCAASPTALPPPQPPSPVRSAAAVQADSFRARPAGSTDGSLFDEHAALSELFIDHKARHVGDIVTIHIVENTTADNKASTTTDRNSNLSAGITGLFNMENKFASANPFFNPFSSVSGSIGSKFAGTGETKRSGALTAYMTARVVDILPNGNLVIEGNREVRVNADNQLITLTGIIRPADVSADNVIQSTYIADARIAYSGKGVLDERQRPGWFTRVLDSIWPF